MNDDASSPSLAEMSRDDIARLVHDLQERNKELRLLHELAAIGAETTLTIEAALQKIVELIPPAWQYPEDTCGRIVVGDLEVRTASFRGTAWKQSSTIEIDGCDAGAVEVCYLAEKPGQDEGPFLREERTLIDSLARQIARIIERRQFDRSLRATNQELEANNQQLVASNSAFELSEEKYRTLVEGALQGVVIAQDGPVRLRFANVAMQSISGYGVDELLCMGPPELAGLIHADDRERFFENFKRRVAGEAIPTVAKYRIVRKDGATSWTMCYSSTIDYLGEPATLTTFVDITDRKHAEEALRRRLHYEKLLAEISAMSVEADNLGSFFERCITVLGERTGVSRVYMFEHDEQSNTMDNTHEWCADGITPQKDELQGVPGDAVPWWIETLRCEEVICYSDIEEIPDGATKEILRPQGILSIVVVPLFVQGQYFGFLGFDDCALHREWLPEDIDILKSISRILTTVIERNRLDDARRKADSRFRLAQDMSPDGFTILRPVRDASGRVVDFVWVYENAAIARLNGTDPEEVVGKRLLDLFPGHRGTPLLSAYRRVAETREPTTFEEGYSGESMPKQIWFRIVVVPMDGDIAVLAQDITERKQAEEDILAANQQLRATEQQLRASNLQLRESEERFRQVYEHMAVGVARVSLDMQIEQANEAYCEMLGYTEEQLSGMHLRDITRPEMIEENLRKQAELVAGEIDHFRMEKAFIHKDGHVVHGILDACLVRTDLDEPAYCLGSVVDITERKRTEKEMARRTAELAALYAGAQSVLAGGDFETMARSLFDKAREVTGARSGYVALLSDSGEENELLFLESGGLACSVEPSLPMPIRGLREVAYESGEVALDNDFMNSSWVSFMPEGHVALDNVLFAPLPVEGRTVGIIGLANKPGGFEEDDRTFAAAMGQLAAVALQKWLAEKEVRSERDRLQVVIQTAPIAILIANEQERIIQVNRAAEALFGRVDDITDEPLRCGDVIACVHRHESPGGCGQGESCASCKVYRAIRDGLAGVTVDDLETEIRIENNGTSARRQMLLNAAPLRLGNRPGVILAANDITQMQALHAKMAQSDRLSSMGMLAAGVAHEINNPLSYVLYNLDSLTEDLPKLLDDVRTVQARFVEQHNAPSVGETDPLTQTMNPAMLDDILNRFEDALGGTRRIRDIARGLGTFSRVERDKPVPVNLMHVIEVAINMSYNEIKYRARLVKEYGRIPTIMASEGRLSQVFLNLLINATHAIEEGDVENNEIRVRTWSDKSHVYAEVRDSGSGIAAEHLGNLFEPFFSTKEVGRGSGLGLAISKNIIEGYGGDISVESEVGKGTSFTLRIPLRTQAEADEGTPIVDTSATPAKGRILIVDDEDAIRAAMVRMLREHETVEASSGAAARQLLEKDQGFDLILCDMMMPAVSGMDLHQWLLANHPVLAERLIFVTGGAFTPKAREYLSKVDNLRLEKPFDVTNFKKIVNDHVTLARGGRGSDRSTSCQRR